MVWFRWPVFVRPWALCFPKHVFGEGLGGVEGRRVPSGPYKKVKSLDGRCLLRVSHCGILWWKLVRGLRLDPGSWGDVMNGDEVVCDSGTGEWEKM